MDLKAKGVCLFKIRGSPDNIENPMGVSPQSGLHIIGSTDFLGFSLRALRAPRFVFESV